jgi:Mn-dependent DtxR family transcriptional regulator
METTATPGFSDPLALRAAWAALRSGGKVRNRDAAERLGVSSSRRCERASGMDLAGAIQFEPTSQHPFDM